MPTGSGFAPVVKYIVQTLANAGAATRLKKTGSMLAQSPR